MRNFVGGGPTLSAIAAAESERFAPSATFSTTFDETSFTRRSNSIAASMFLTLSNKPTSSLFADALFPSAKATPPLAAVAKVAPPNTDATSPNIPFILSPANGRVRLASSPTWSEEKHSPPLPTVDAARRFVGIRAAAFLPRASNALDLETQNIFTRIASPTEICDFISRVVLSVARSETPANEEG